MITIFENKSSRFANLHKKTILCPSCKNKVMFYNASPEKCSQCNGMLLDYTNILQCKFYRFNYHFGIVDNLGIICPYI